MAASQATLARQQCEAKREALLKKTPAPGTPELEANWRDILVRTKAEPVIFTRPPPFEEASRTIRQFRASLESARYPSAVLQVLLKGFRIHPENGRATLLRSGYLYADREDIAYLLVELVRAEHLFDDPHIWIQRGDRSYHATRNLNGSYIYEDGPHKGKQVQLILYDRIGAGPKPPALHRDVRSLRYRLHFDRLTIEHLTDSGILATLHYGGLKIPTVLKAEGPRLELDCEIVDERAEKDLKLYRSRGERLLRTVQALRGAMINQIDERLPFDEPRVEYGQQDGQLRRRWLREYAAGSKHFTFNGDRYYVFDAEGRPLVPQVCVDFLVDTFERAGGSWWRPSGELPKRTKGTINFAELAKSPLRRVPEFVGFARARAEWFHVYDTAPNERIPFYRRDAFYSYLQKHARRFVPGDIIVIRGYTNFERPWQQQRAMHYHSFFVYESDPITGIPIAIVGNAGYPTIRTWHTEARRTPRRSIWHRVRPTLHWLETIIPEGPVDHTPAPLSVGAR